ncbi:MAG: endonuclease I [Gammaproteobacteria bacterium]|nr:MAG: endonuclease I [Gammaproteobacteria bacterium]
MKGFAKLAVSACAFASLWVHAAPSPDEVIEEKFWGQLYANGGTTFYCQKPFRKKSILITESHIYSDTWIRETLDCGTPRLCARESEDYRVMVSDLHNLQPADARVELERRSARFEELGADVPKDECGIRRSFGVIDPPPRIRGDIARAILYMHERYGLPLVGDLPQLQRWNRLDPPDEAEKTRNELIRQIQGNTNPFIDNPARADMLSGY